MERKLKSGQRDLLIGAIFLLGGMAATAVSFLLTAAHGGGEFLIGTGAIVFGAYRLIRGMLRASTR